ncbi:hypothetical protein MHYP_G00249850 [Metynnis hypsauchen]
MSHELKDSERNKVCERVKKENEQLQRGGGCCGAIGDARKTATKSTLNTLKTIHPAGGGAGSASNTHSSGS